MLAQAATHPIAIRGTCLIARCWGIAGGTGVENIAAAAMRPAVPPGGGGLVAACSCR